MSPKIILKNKVIASVSFDFKGQRYTPELEIDLDSHMQASGSLPDLYPLLARVCNLGLYSYEYEMLQAEKIVYSQATGIAEDHIDDGILDLCAFESAWLDRAALVKLSGIAQDVLGVSNLSDQKDLQKALLLAYQLGKCESVKEEVSSNHSF